MGWIPLKIGDPAPLLQTGRWLQGEPVTRFEPDKIYVVELWSTWCGPCIRSIAHLNELHLKYARRNVVIIGQNVLDYDDDSVERFVKNMGAKMCYRVALDDRTRDRKGAMRANWLLASKQPGIPAAFAINKERRIAWIGHPDALDETVLGDILAERFDIVGYAREYHLALARSEKFGEGRRRVFRAMKEKRWDAAEIALAETAELENWKSECTGLIRLQILLGRNDRETACQLAGSLSASHKADMSLHNSLAWYLVTSGHPDSQSLQLAQKLADHANQLAGGQVAGVLDTLARVLYLQGKTREAIAFQEQALRVACDFERHVVEKTLDNYSGEMVPGH